MSFRIISILFSLISVRRILLSCTNFVVGLVYHTMIAHQNNEETPLVQRPEQQMARTSPLPWDRFWIISFLQSSDSLICQTLAPFTPQVSIFSLLGLEYDHNRDFVKLIRDIGMTNGDESQVGHYVGILVSMSPFFVVLRSFLISFRAIIVLYGPSTDYSPLESTV
ncbi:hypothetical protein BDR05DRAFT_775584 [Suillus weaverae]|nr:hypothetical protein BDR05DRAFT_775584 [Suillus weaverae]